MRETFRRFLQRYVINPLGETGFPLPVLRDRKNLLLNNELNSNIDRIFNEPLVRKYSFKYEDDLDWKEDFPNLLFFYPELSDKKMTDIGIEKQKSFRNGNFEYFIYLDFGTERRYSDIQMFFVLHDSSVFILYDSKHVVIKSRVNLVDRGLDKEDADFERETFRMEVAKEAVSQILRLKAKAVDEIE